MRRYNMLQAIYLSFYSKRLYQDVAVNWSGNVFLYLLLVLALSWVIPTYWMQIGLERGHATFSKNIVPQIPVMEIKEGKITTPLAQPYVITDPRTNARMAVIDTQGQYKTPEEAKAPFLITKTEIINKSYNETKIYRIPETLTATINPISINEFIGGFIQYSWIIFFICALLLSYLYRLIQTILYALFGMLLSKVNRMTLTYGQIYKIAIVALTPAIILSTIFTLVSFNFAYELMFYFLLTMGYLYFGILSNKTSK